MCVTEDVHVCPRVCVRTRVTEQDTAMSGPVCPRCRDRRDRCVVAPQFSRNYICMYIYIYIYIYIYYMDAQVCVCVCESVCVCECTSAAGGPGSSGTARAAGGVCGGGGGGSV